MPILPNPTNAGLYVFKAKKAHVESRDFAFEMKMELTIQITAN
jgi:hypothetical protein